MTERKFNLVLSLVACFVAVEAGALAVCLGVMVLDSGPLAILEGMALWVLGQFFILPMALFSMPIGALVRMILGLNFDQPRSVALLAGATVGLVGSLLFALSNKVGLEVWPHIVFVGSMAGIVGGWAWWRVEKPFLDRQKPPGGT